MALTELCQQQRDIANALFRSEGECLCSEMGHGKPSCIQRAEEAPLTKAEKKDGWARRPFYAYDTSKMCKACEAYYHAERAAQILHEMHCLGVRCEAKDSRETADAVK